MNRNTRWLGIGLSALFVLTIPLWLTSNFWLHIVNFAGITVIAVVGLNYITGETGQISIGHAAFFGIGAYTAAILGKNLGWNFWPGILAAGVVTAGFGVLIGLPTLRLKGHYLAIATIGLNEIIRLIFNNWRSLTNGFDGIGEIPHPSTFGFTVEGEVAFYYLILAFVVAFLVLAVRVKESSFGRSMIAMRDNEMAAEAMGISATTTKVLAFGLATFYAGIAGGLYAHLFTYISPDTFSVDLSIVFLAMLILGGTGSIAGATIAAIFLTLLPEWLRPLEQYYMILYGAIIILSIVFMPKGFLAAARNWQERRQKKDARVMESAHGR